MKIIVAGTRDYNNVKLIREHLEKLDITTLICGMCKGVDKIAFDYCKEKNIPIDIYPAKWEEFGKAAGPIRNQEMSEVADMAICFWDGISRGTKDMITKMRKKRKPVTVIRYK